MYNKENKKMKKWSIKECFLFTFNIALAVFYIIFMVRAISDGADWLNITLFVMGAVGIVCILPVMIFVNMRVITCYKYIPEHKCECKEE